MTEPLAIGTHKQLFIDDRFVAESEGVRRVMNPPVQHPEPVFRADRPWEALGMAGYNSVLREPDGRFRLWYGGMMKSGLPQEGAARLCYADSADGLHWEKPSLGVVTFQGSTDNNIVAPTDERQSQQGATVYRDERAPAEERYKLWTKFRPTDAEIEAGAGEGLYAMHSADGIRWSVYPGQPNPPHQASDTQNMFFWDDRLACYVGYTRVRETQTGAEAAEGSVGHYRAIGRITSPDFHHWSDTQVVMEADEADLNMPLPAQPRGGRPVLDYYTSCAMKYAHAQDVYLAMPSIYYHWGEDEFPATMDVQLHVSRDGIAWQRPGERRPFLRHGREGTPASGMLFANPWLIDVDDELWIYFVGRGHRHNRHAASADQSALYRATLRRDGFVSLDAGYHGGTFTTPPLSFTGNCLEFNCDTSAGGWLQVELQDASGQALPGHRFTESEVVHGNAIAKRVAWQGGSDLSALAGQTVRMQVRMRDAKLYAFQFPQAAR